MNRPHYEKRAYEGSNTDTDYSGGGVAVAEPSTGLEGIVDTTADPREVLRKFPDVKPKEYVTGGAE